MDHDKRIDKLIAFVPVNIAILTVSDSRQADDDRSGDLLVGRVQEDGHNLAGRAIVTDDFDAITKQLRSWVDDKAVDVIVATGGTGLTGRDGTPEAFRAIFKKEIEGFGETTPALLGLAAGNGGKFVPSEAVDKGLAN